MAEEKGPTGKTEATINGVPILAVRQVVWRMKEGVEPVIETFDVRPQDLRTLTPGRQVTLIISGPKGTMNFEGLRIIDHPPGMNPELAAVRVADRRWFWKKKHVVRRFNVRRNIGTKRAPNPVAELQTLLPSIQYAPYSLKNQEGGVKWTAEEALKAVLEEVTKAEPGSRSAPLAIPGGLLASLPIENLVIDDRGDLVIMRMLRYLPGLALFVTPAGGIALYNRGSGEEIDFVRRHEPELVSSGHAELVDNTFLRPKEVHVLFSYEVEVRFDFNELSGATVVIPSELEKDQKRLLDNVLPIPDFSLLVNGTTQAQGTWINLQSAMTAWGPAPGLAAPIDYRFLRIAAMPYIELYGALDLLVRAAPDADWMSRVAALQQHFRRTFRLPQRWVDRMLSMRAYRVATVDPTTGSRAPSNAYANYSIVSSQRAFHADRELQRMIQSVKGYPVAGIIAEDTHPIPAEVSVIDEDQGILQLDFLSDPARVYTIFLPGETSGSPTGDVAIAGRSGTPVAFDALPGDKEPFALLPNWKLLVILTLVPAAPNLTDQLFRVEVKPHDVANLLPARAVISLADCTGPIQEIRIPASVETARVRWLDNRAQDIVRLFGVGINSDVTPGIARILVKDLIVNAEGTGDTKAGSLQGIAEAAAAQIYASMPDQYRGSPEYDLNTKETTELAGSLDEIIFILEPDGVAKISVNLAGGEDGSQEFPIWSFLDDGTREVVMHLVQV